MISDMKESTNKQMNSIQDLERKVSNKKEPAEWIRKSRVWTKKNTEEKYSKEIEIKTNKDMLGMKNSTKYKTHTE